ncbi:EKC/KEOPS complex subunit GON7 [Xenopus laevis]|uniref:EKC/KEOPS complex subunit GON7 n=2 Tax=Xenopus laevis TaxID=8355 RepID=A0A1L8F0G4_XENLA|nr:EKC/KEOPS complex subunit GON7 [Xenopus laevis]OCT65063.1 hypothetical protein XELAEV_18041305mg [Xenopus laevis]
MELSAELSNRDGSSRPFQVRCERTLKGLANGLEQLKGEVSAVLTELVLQEKGEGALAAGDQESAGEEEDEEDTDEKDFSENGISSNGPPTKRNKIQD